MNNSEICYTNFKFLCKNDKCNVCTPRSFYLSNSIYIKYWDYIKNNIDIKIIPKGTNKNYWFNCPTCNHSFQRPIKKLYNITKFEDIVLIAIHLPIYFVIKKMIVYLVIINLLLLVKNLIILIMI